jgi:hypothetical protein
LLLWYCMFANMMFFGFWHPKNDTVSFLRETSIWNGTNGQTQSQTPLLTNWQVPMKIRTIPNSFPFRWTV